MGKGKKLTEYECGQVYAYRQSGMSLREIARTISKSVKCVHSFLKDTANYKNKSSAKRPKIISSSMERRLIKTVKADRSVTSAEQIACNYQHRLERFDVNSLIRR